MTAVDTMSVATDHTTPSLVDRARARVVKSGPVVLGFVAFAIVLDRWPQYIGDPTRIRQWAEYLCYAMIAVGICIAWGRGGMLTLGQGVFFGLGAYSMGMYLSLENVPDGAMPEFMSLYSDYKSLPLMWQPFRSLWFAAIAAVLGPMLVAGALGWLVFNRRIRGAYFAILTQAAALVFWLLLVGQLQLTAGTNGLTNFSEVFGRSKYAEGTNEFLFGIAAVGLFATLVIARQVVKSRYGKLLVATRDGEDRVRFLGYDPAVTKTIAFALSAGMAGLAGAISAPIIGIVAPNQFAVIPSILMVAWVAIGGRTSIYGAVIGALLVSWGKTSFSESRPDDWLYIQGALFVIVVAFFPGGIVGGLHSLADFAMAPVRKLRARGSSSDAADGVNAPRAATPSKIDLVAPDAVVAPDAPVVLEAGT
ncbi:MAG: urea ABC transporter permease subunit UrtC [Acidimicrobiia bacterium]